MKGGTSVGDIVLIKLYSARPDGYEEIYNHFGSEEIAVITSREIIESEDGPPTQYYRVLTPLGSLQISEDDIIKNINVRKDLIKKNYRMFLSKLE